MIKVSLIKFSSYQFTLIAVFLFMSCSKEKKTIKNYYENGKLMEKIEVINDTIRHGDYKGYHPNGELATKMTYVNNKVEGEVIEYYPSGTIKRKAYFENNIQNGPVVSYNKNGKKISETTVKNGKKVGEGVLYNNNGELSAYIFYNRDGNVRYRRDYDEKGRFIEESGVGIFDVILNEDHLKVNEEFEAKFTFVTPPDCKINLYCGDRDKLENFKIEKIPSEHKYTYKRILNKIGVFEWGVRLELISKQDSTIRTHNYKVDVIVEKHSSS